MRDPGQSSRLRSWRPSLSRAGGGTNILTDRQREFLLLYARTGSRDVVAEELGISPKSVTNRLSTIRRRLNVKTTVQAIYVVMGGDDAAALDRDALRENLLAYLKAEWLDDAMKAASHAAVEAMVEAVDHTFYMDSVVNRGSAETKDIDLLHYLYQEAAGLRRHGWTVQPPSHRAVS